MKTLLITGANGFIGRRMTAVARAAGWNVIGLDRDVPDLAPKKVPSAKFQSSEIATRTHIPAATSGDRRGGVLWDHGSFSSPAGVLATGHCSPPAAFPTWLSADITKDDPIDLPAGIDAIIHLAGKAHALAEAAHDEDEYFQINTEGTRRMLEAAQRACVRSFVLFSTVKAMGGAASGQAFSSLSHSAAPGKAVPQRPSVHQHETPNPQSGSLNLAAAAALDETCLFPPDTPYGQSKRAAEKLVLEGNYVPHPVVLRPCLVYGPAPKGNLDKMIGAVKRGRFPPLPEVGNKRSMVHIDDVIAAALLAVEHPSARGQVFIAADNEPFSTRQLFEWICVAAGRRVPRWRMPLCLLRLLGRIGDLIGKARGRRFVFDSDALDKLISSAWYSSAKLQRELGWTRIFLFFFGIL